MQATNTRPRFEPTADGHGICSHAGVVLLAELADRLGLTAELGRRANLGLARPGGSHAHDRGAVLRDLVVMLADGGVCLRDLAGLRDQGGLFGRVCSTPTAWRVVGQVAADPRGVAALWSALARVRERAWALGGVPTGPLTIDLDATLVGAHSDKQGTRPTYKHGFGFHPLCCWLDRGDGTGEALSGILRPGNAGANTAQDHIDVLAMALLALPKAARSGPILVRADTAGATHAFVADIVRRKLLFSIGFPLEPDVKAAILAMQAPADDGDHGGWVRAADPHGRQRPGAWVCELSALDLASQGWPTGTRAICRRERPHPGARHKMGFTDHTGHRFQVSRHQPARPRPRHPRGAPPRPPAPPGTTPRAGHQRHRRPRGGPPRPRPRRGPDPLRQGHRPWQPAVCRLWRQRRLAHPGRHRPDPGLLGTGTAACRRQRACPRRAQDPALPAVARRRPAGLPRPPGHLALRPRLAVGSRAAGRVRAAAGLAMARPLLTTR